MYLISQGREFQAEGAAMKMSGSQMCSFLRAEFVEFLSQRRSGDVLMESNIHEEGQKSKQVQFRRKRSDEVFTFCTRFVVGIAASEEF